MPGGISPRLRSAKRMRSHFWAPVSRAKRPAPAPCVLAVSVPAQTPADGCGNLDARGAATPIESTIYLSQRDGASACAGAWRGMRGNASAPMSLIDVAGAERALTDPGRARHDAGVVLPAFQVGTAAVAVGIAEAAAGDHRTRHEDASEHEQLCRRTADRARADRAHANRDRLRARASGAVLDSLEMPARHPADGPGSGLATEAAVTVTDLGCGSGRFGGAHGIERLFRDARARRHGADKRSGYDHRTRCAAWCSDGRPLKVGVVMRPQGVGHLGNHPRLFDWQACPIDVAFYTYELRRGPARPDDDIAWNSPLAWPDAQRRRAAPAGPPRCATPIATACRTSSRAEGPVRRWPTWKPTLATGATIRHRRRSFRWDGCGGTASIPADPPSGASTPGRQARDHVGGERRSSACATRRRPARC